MKSVGQVGRSFHVRTQRPHDISTGVWTQRPTHFPLKATKYILETTQLQRESDTYYHFADSHRDLRYFIYPKLSLNHPLCSFQPVSALHMEVENILLNYPFVF